MKSHVEYKYTEYEYGFPVKIDEVTVLEEEYGEVPLIDYEAFAHAVLKCLIWKPAQLTGNEVRFIRLHQQKTLTEFAEDFGLCHVTIMKWEECGDRATSMKWSTERDLRLGLYLQLDASGKDASKLYGFLQKPYQKDEGQREYEVSGVSPITGISGDEEWVPVDIKPTVWNDTYDESEHVKDAA